MENSYLSGLNKKADNEEPLTVRYNDPAKAPSWAYLQCQLSNVKMAHEGEDPSIEAQFLCFSFCQRQEDEVGGLSVRASIALCSDVQCLSVKPQF